MKTCWVTPQALLAQQPVSNTTSKHSAGEEQEQDEHTCTSHPRTSVAFNTFTGRNFLVLAFVHQVVPRRSFSGVFQANLPEERAECSRSWRMTSSCHDEPDSFEVCLTFSWLLHTGRWNSQTLFKPVTMSWTSVTSFLNHTFPSHMEHLSHGSHSRSLTTGVAFPPQLL